MSVFASEQHKELQNVKDRQNPVTMIDISNGVFSMFVRGEVGPKSVAIKSGDHLRALVSRAIEVASSEQLQSEWDRTAISHKLIAEVGKTIYAHNRKVNDQPGLFGAYVPFGLEKSYLG